MPISEDWHGKPFDVNGVKVALLPDAHLGRKFVTDVPLHRRGERETMVESDFCRHLAMAGDADLHVCVGDIFDKPVVTPDAVLFAADAYLNAVDAYTDCQFVVYPGNHDLSRDLGAQTSYDLLRRILEAAERSNLTVLRDHPMIETVKGRAFGFVPWHPVKSSAEITQELLDRLPWTLSAVFGHWDVINPGSDHNLIPVETLRGRTNLIVTGHDHRRRLMQYGDVQVLVTGSMQPYAHGEDVTGEMYRTVTLAELARIEDTRNLCLRVVLAEGEELPEIDALQVKAVRAKSEEAEAIEVGFDTFDMEKIFAEVFTAKGVSSDILGLVMDRYRTERV